MPTKAELERAVIEAARALSREDAFARNEIDAVIEAAKALDDFESSQAAVGISEVEWRHVVAGDQVRGRSGTFYPVAHAQAVAGGKSKLTIAMPGKGNREIIRPSDAEPTATVRRSDTGAVVDVFIDVFTSGTNR